MYDILTAISSISPDTCTDTDMEGLCMKKTCEDNWEKGLREEAEGLFQINLFNVSDAYKLGCVLRMVVDSILPNAKFGPNDHRKDAPPFIET